MSTPCSAKHRCLLPSLISGQNPQNSVARTRANNAAPGGRRPVARRRYWPLSASGHWVPIRRRAPSVDVAVAACPYPPNLACARRAFVCGRRGWVVGRTGPVACMRGARWNAARKATLRRSVQTKESVLDGDRVEESKKVGLCLPCHLAYVQLVVANIQ